MSPSCKNPILLAFTLAALASGQAVAQGAGVSAAAFTAKPSITLRWLNDDNVYAVNDEGEVPSDAVFSIKPEAHIVSDWTRHELRASVGADTRRFADLSSEDTTDLTGEVSGRVDVTTNLEIDAGFGLARQHEPRGDPDTPRSITEPVAYSSRRHHIGTEWHPGRLHFALGLREHSLSYDDGQSADGELILQQDRDRIERDWTFETALDVSDVRMFLRFARYQRSYENLTRGFNRDGSGNGRMVGVRHRVTSLLALEAFYGQRKHELADARLGDADGPVYGVTMDYRPTTRTTISVRAERTIEETALARASGYTRRAVQFDLAQQVTPKVALHCRLGADHRDYLGIDREYDHLFWSIEADWQPTNSLALGIGYSSQNRVADPAIEDYTRSIPFVRLTWAP